MCVQQALHWHQAVHALADPCVLLALQMQRLWRYKNKQRIKEDNMLRKKG